MSAPVGSSLPFRRAALVVLTVAAFLGVASLVRSAMPLPNEVGMRARFEAFASMKDEVDAIYMGSSRVVRSFQPNTIDPILSQSGRPFRSFNLGVGGMSPRETTIQLERVLAMKPANLRLVVVEAQGWGVRFPGPKVLFSERSVSWRSPTAVASALVPILTTPAPLDERASRIWAHTQLLAMWLASQGRGPSALRAWLDRDDEAYRAEVATAVRLRGYGDTDEVVYGTMQRARYLFVQSRERYEAMVDERREERPGKRPAPFSDELIAWQTSLVDAAGLQLVYVVPPRVKRDLELEAMVELGRLPNLLDFSDPDAYPELYEAEARYDNEHLNVAGAERFSRQFAHALARIPGVTTPPR